MLNTFNQTARKVPIWAVYSVGLLFAAWMVWQALTGGAGPDPIKALERGFGERGLQLLIAALCITPLRWVGVNLLKFRRAIGLLAFAFITLHFATWIVLDMGLRWSEIISDLFKRPYIIIGFAAFLVLIPLAISSNNASVKRLGAAGWNRLHWLTYPATLAGAVHFVMIGKVYTLESALYLAAVAALLLARRVKAQKRASGAARAATA